MLSVFSLFPALCCFSSFHVYRKKGVHACRREPTCRGHRCLPHHPLYPRLVLGFSRKKKPIYTRPISLFIYRHNFSTAGFSTGHVSHTRVKVPPKSDSPGSAKRADSLSRPTPDPALCQKVKPTPFRQPLLDWQKRTIRHVCEKIGKLSRETKIGLRPKISGLTKARWGGQVKIDLWDLCHSSIGGY